MGTDRDYDRCGYLKADVVYYNYRQEAAYEEAENLS